MNVSNLRRKLRMAFLPEGTRHLASFDFPLEYLCSRRQASSKNLVSLKITYPEVTKHDNSPEIESSESSTPPTKVPPSPRARRSSSRLTSTIVSNSTSSTKRKRSAKDVSVNAGGGRAEDSVLTIHDDTDTLLENDLPSNAQDVLNAPNHVEEPKHEAKKPRRVKQDHTEGDHKQKDLKTPPLDETQPSASVPAPSQSPRSASTRESSMYATFTEEDLIIKPQKNGCGCAHDHSHAHTHVPSTDDGATSNDDLLSTPVLSSHDDFDRGHSSHSHDTPSSRSRSRTPRKPIIRERRWSTSHVATPDDPASCRRLHRKPSPNPSFPSLSLDIPDSSNEASPCDGSGHGPSRDGDGGERYSIYHANEDVSGSTIGQELAPRPSFSIGSFFKLW